MKRLLPLLAGFLPALFGFLELTVFTNLSSTFALGMLLGTLLFLPVWWCVGYFCGKLRLGLLRSVVLANLPMLLGFILFCIGNLPGWLNHIVYANMLPSFSLFLGASFMGSSWLSALLCALPIVGVFWLGCSKHYRRS